MTKWQTYPIFIDVSHWNPLVDFVKLKEDGCRLVVNKMFELNDTGGVWTDATFQGNLQKAYDAGMP